MWNDPATNWFVAARAVHFAACMLLLAVCAFDRLVIGEEVRRQSPVVAKFWSKIAAWIFLISLLPAGLSGVAWFGSVVIAMTGLPFADALTPHFIGLVWSHTRFGSLWHCRAACWIAQLILAANLPTSRRYKSSITWLLTIFSALLLATLAWSGHGQYGTHRDWHLLADVVHLLTCAFWPAGLFPFALLLFTLRRQAAPQDWQTFPRIISRFSAISLISVALLTISGLANACFLLGSVVDLYRTRYGQVLSIKILLFVLMTMLGAVNLLRLKPRLCRDPASTHHPSARTLQATTAMELFLSSGVIIAIALLGLLAPPHD